MGEVSLTKKIILTSEIADWQETKANLQKPARQLWHGAAEFQDGTPAVDAPTNVWPVVTWWEKEEDEPIGLGNIDHTGRFRAAFSEAEMKALKGGEAWLTLTVGNQSVKPKRDGPRLAPGKFKLEADEVKPVKVSRPQVSYGRLLFQDGTPAVLDQKPWPSAEIFVDFSYTGIARVDPEGYFQTSLTPEQMESIARRKKQRPNVYIPSFTRRNSSRALHHYPVDSLAPEKKDAGVLRIPRPGPKKNP